jgi:hypothetical protein
MKDDLPTLHKKIEELRKSICYTGMKQFCTSNIRKQQQLKELANQLDEQIHEEKTKTI